MVAAWCPQGGRPLHHSAKNQKPILRGLRFNPRLIVTGHVSSCKEPSEHCKICKLMQYVTGLARPEYTESTCPDYSEDKVSIMMGHATMLVRHAY